MVESVLSWLVEQVATWGLLGIFVMLFLESTFCPFPSEVAMIPAGYLAYQGQMSFTAAIIAGILGSLLGSLFNYYLARKIGIPVLRRYGRYIFFDESKLERCNALFRKHGEIATFVCRLIPVVRQYISLPAGLAGMNLLRFSFYTSLGAGIWVALLTAFGYWVGSTLKDLEGDPTWQTLHQHWEQHEKVILLSTLGFLVAVVAAYVIFSKRRKASTTEGSTEATEPSEERVS